MSKRRILTVAGWVLGVLFVAGSILPIVTVRTRTRMSCALCRAERTDRTFLGISWQTFHDTEFAAWYRAHQPEHEHVWGRESCTVGSSLIGVTTYFDCGRRHPVCDIPQSALLEYCERADNSTLTAYFNGIRSTNPEVQARTAQMVVDSVFEKK